MASQHGNKLCYRGIMLSEEGFLKQIFSFSF